MPKVRELVGQRFGMLVVVFKRGERKNGKVTWACDCDCGGRSAPTTSALTTGNSRSCGCTRGAPSGEGHGHARVGKHTPEYVAWQGMKDRCLNPNNSAWAGYGGRGIQVCARWKDSFSAFLEDVGPCPGPNYSIDRIKNEGNYEPGNIRWATRRQQNLNTRRTRRVTYEGRTLTLVEWCEELGVSYNAMRLRLQAGWSDERALATPVAKKKLTREKADQIRAEYEAGGETYESLGTKYGVRPDYVGKILCGKNWKSKKRSAP